MTQIPPFWGFILAASLLVILLDVAPRIGGGLLVLIVLGTLLLYERRGKAGI